MDKRGNELIAIAASSVLVLNLIYHISKIVRNTGHTISKTIERKKIGIRRNYERNIRLHNQKIMVKTYKKMFIGIKAAMLKDEFQE
jgi:hypothetical protein